MLRGLGGDVSVQRLLCWLADLPSVSILSLAHSLLHDLCSLPGILLEQLRDIQRDVLLSHSLAFLAFQHASCHVIQEVHR